MGTSLGDCGSHFLRDSTNINIGFGKEGKMNDISTWDMFYEHILPFTLIFLCIVAIIGSALLIAMLCKDLFLD